MHLMRWSLVGAAVVLAMATPALASAGLPLGLLSSPTTTSTTTTTTTTTAPVGSATTAASSSTAAPTCGGQSTLVADRVTWTCTFDSEFDGTGYDTSAWTALTTANSGFTQAGVCYEDDPGTVSVGRGYLSLTVRKLAQPFVCSSPAGSFVTSYVGGFLTTYQKFSQTYGRFEVVAKVPPATVAGLQSSLWLYPESLSQDSEGGTTAEIDMAEWYSKYPDREVPYIHYDASSTNSGSTGVNAVTNTNCIIDQSAFNDYVVEWTPTTITMIYNGTTCLQDQWSPASPEVAPQPFDEPFFVNLTQALGIGANAVGATTPLPATTEIKSVRVWQGNFSG